MEVEGCVINMPQTGKREGTIARSDTLTLMGQGPSDSCSQAVTYTGDTYTNKF